MQPGWRLASLDFHAVQRIIMLSVYIRRTGDQHLCSRVGIAERCWVGPLPSSWSFRDVAPWLYFYTHLNLTISIVGYIRMHMFFGLDMAKSHFSVQQESLCRYQANHAKCNHILWNIQGWGPHIWHPAVGGHLTDASTSRLAYRYSRDHVD